ncbi:hypothetical protein ACFX1R_039155 [Malus domestica]
MSLSTSVSKQRDGLDLESQQEQIPMVPTSASCFNAFSWISLTSASLSDLVLPATTGRWRRSCWAATGSCLRACYQPLIADDEGIRKT